MSNRPLNPLITPLDKIYTDSFLIHEPVTAVCRSIEQISYEWETYGTGLWYNQARDLKRGVFLLFDWFREEAI
jgi:hypothetical protein